MASMEIVSMLNCALASALTAALAALCLYLAVPRQRLWPAALGRAKFLRWLSVPLATGALAAAIEDYGFGPGLGIVLGSMAVVWLALPHVDPWLQRGKPHKA